MDLRMAGGKEDEADPPPAPAPPPSLDEKQPMEDAAGGKLGRSEHHHGVAVADAPSFRMEDLPAEIRTLIISLLPLKEAVRTSIVSTSWRMLWTFHCNLCFDGPNVPDSYADDDTDDEFAYLDYDTDDEFAHQDSTKMTRAKFIEIVNWVIQRHSGIGINNFSIKCALLMEYSDHLDRWIEFAASSKAKIINLDLTYKDYIFQEVYHFPLEALDAEGSSFVQSLFLAGVSIKPHSGICGFTILKRLVLECVQIFGDFPGLLAKCSALEDLEIIGCYGVTNLSIPHKLDKLQHLVIDNDSTMGIEIVEFHAADLAHFEYIGRVIPIVLHCCSKLEKAKILFKGTKALARAFTAVPSILPVKTLNVQAFITEYAQLQKLPTRPQGMFMHLRHMTCQLTVYSSDRNADNGVLQLAHCLDAAPGLETLHLHMCYDNLNGYCSSEVVSMRPHGNLKTVFMSGFHCYKTQIELACCILGNACVLEQLTIEPRVILGNACVLEQLTIEPRVTDSVCPIDCPDWNIGLKRILQRVCEWAQITSERFGKVITVLGAPLHKMEPSLARQEAGSLQRNH